MTRDPNVVAEAAAVYVFARLALCGLADDNLKAIRDAAEEAGLATYTRDGDFTLTTLGRRVAISSIRPVRPTSKTVAERLEDKE